MSPGQGFKNRELASPLSNAGGYLLPQPARATWIKREVAGLTAQERDLTETGAECIFGEQVSSVAKR